jgi:thiol-disulfide isomerase/thioredoxin
MKKPLLSLSLFLLLLPAFGQFSPQNVVIDEFTGTWCGWCPDGAVILNNILDQQPSAIAVAMHSGDSLETAQTDSFAAFYSPAYPMACINRGGEPVSRGGWSSAAQQAANGASSVSLSFDSLAYVEATRIVIAKIKADFTGFENGDLRLGLMIIEDSLSGTGRGWDQVNYLNGQAGHPYAGAGDPIRGYVHRHNFREAVGSVWGNPGIIPNLVNFGSEVEHTFTFQLSPRYNVEQIHLVVFASRYDGNNISDRRILNGEKVHLLSNLTPTNTSIDGKADFAREVRVYPNPFQEQVAFSFDLKQTGWVQAEMLDINGRTLAVLAEGIMNHGTHSLNWDAREVPAGLYLFRITSSAQESIVKRVMKK